MALTADQRFRRVADYALDMGFPGAFPNFHEADYGKGAVGGVTFFRPNAVEWRDIPASDLGNPVLWDIPALCRAACDYAARNGFLAAIPNCHQATYAAGQVFGINLIPHGAAVFRDVARAQLGNPAITDVPAMMRASADYAAANGFAGGFPTFHQADYGQGVVYGQVLFRQASVEWRDVYVGDLEPVEKKVCVILAQFQNPDGSMLPTLRDPHWYEDYVLGRQRDSLSDFFRFAANLRINVWGNVFGWLDIGHSTTEHAALGGIAQRVTVFNWAVDAARAQGIPVDDYPHKLVIVNRHTDFGGVGGPNVLMPHAADSDPNYVDNFHSFMEHEFGHLLELDHGWGPGGPYRDYFCIMSFQTWAQPHQRTIAGLTANAGCGLNVVYSAALGGMPDHRRIDVDPNIGAATATICASGYPDVDTPQAIRLRPASPNASTYWVSFRHPSRWDRAIIPSVLLHEEKPNDHRSYFLPGPNGGALRAAGDEMLTPDGHYRVKLKGFSSGGPLAEVEVQYQ
jgi:hypothetical protein